MNIKIIVAYTKVGRVIGRDGAIPWNLPEDRKFFKKVTMGEVILMGRKTWNSLYRKLLPNRFHIILSRSKNINNNKCDLPNLIWTTNIFEAIDYCKNNLAGKLIYVIGGERVYQEFLDYELVNEVIATEIKQEYVGDTFFPVLNGMWRKTFIEEGENFDIIKYKKDFSLDTS